MSASVLVLVLEGPLGPALSRLLAARPSPHELAAAALLLRETARTAGKRHPASRRPSAT
ncbi:hypothetical protein RKD26_004736 [Streptomyces calvus]|uniref:hypothetical protein n=1 Tax=Streptomyces calvus TaxID=67282 RepID=UPI00351877E8